MKTNARIHDDMPLPEHARPWRDLYTVSRDQLSSYVRAGDITPHEAARELDRRRLRSMLFDEGSE